jgi:hypothetical protein
VKRFGHSESAAYQRTSALKLIRDAPAAKEALAKGETSMTTMADTQKFITRLDKENPLSAKDKEDIFNKTKGKTRKEALSLFAELNPVAALPETREKPLTSQHTLLQVTIEQETQNLLNELKSVLSHEIPDGNLNLVLKKIAIIGLDHFRKMKGRSEPKQEQYSCSVAKAKETGIKGRDSRPIQSDLRPAESNLRSAKRCSNKTANAINVGDSSNTHNRGNTKAPFARKRKAIPIEVRRQAFAKANHQCEFVSENGQRCESRYQLEIDHRVPWSQGGLDEPDNLQVLCASHNRYRTKHTHGYWFQVKQA